MKLVFFILCLSAFLCDASALVPDGVTLLSLLRHWAFLPPSINSSWKASDSTPCSWVGVQCDHVHNVVSLNLTGHGIFGQLGPEIGQLHQLQTIVLLNNSFSGNIPSELGNCSLLGHLDLSQNSFGGGIPNELGKLSELKDLVLSFNRLTGKIPVSIWRIQSLKHILVHNNSLSGELPLDMTELKHLRNISLFDNRFSGVIPQSLGINSSLVKLDFMNNKFTGTIPPNLCFGKQLSVLNIGLNELQGGIPSDVGRCPTLRRLVLTQNNLIGSLPDFESSFNLTYIDVRRNKISGAIPSSLGNCTNLTDVIFSMNKLNGLVPSELGMLGNLLTLDLSHNNLEGPLPPQLSNCTKMDRFDVGFNFLDGSFPSSFRSWTDLTTLILSKNRFTGGIPGLLSQFDYLRELQLGGNLFRGEIPRSMGALQNLFYALNLSDNGLTGEIPLEIGKLKMLQILDVSLNNLTGSIEVFDRLPSLIEVDISYNSFKGPVPKNLMKLLHSSPSSFMGNSQLCVSCSHSDGSNCTYLKPCSYEFTDSLIDHKRISKFVIIMIVVGSLIFVFAMLLVLLYMHLRRRSKQEVYASDEEQGSLSSIDTRVKIHGEANLSILVSRVMKATDNFNDQHVVGRGAHGIVYKAQLSPYQVLAVKKIEFSMNKGRSSHKPRDIMLREIHFVKMINHRNLVRYRDYWFGKDYGLILYKYFENGSLHDVLHEKNPPPSVKWNVRLKIAVGVARGLAYLHYDCHPLIVHRDIKPKNILLDSEMEPFISDFGTAVCRERDEHSRSPSCSRLSASIAGTLGFIAPENAYAIVQSRKSDVYSYGVVLLELLTRKKVLDQSFLEEETTLVKWARSVWMETSNIGEIVDSCLASEFSHSIVETQVTAVLGLALKCTERDPRNRPTMRDVMEFYGNGTMLNWWYGTAIAVDEAPRQYNSPDRIPHVPAVNISLVSALSEEVSSYWQSRDSLVDKKSKFESYFAWSFPPGGWVKISTRGCAEKNSQAACGGVIRGHSGEWIRGFSVSLGSCPIDYAEIWGLYYGLSVAWDLRFPSVIIETDSLAAFLLMHIPTDKVHKLPVKACADPIALCHELIQREWKVKIQHIFREGNICADWLANRSLGYNVGNVVYLEPPAGLVALLDKDIFTASRPS